MSVYQSPSADGGGVHYELGGRFLFNHIVLENVDVSKEVYQLPEEHFKSVQGAKLNCWRFETADGRKFTAGDWEIDRFLDGTVILRRTYPSRARSDKEGQPVRELKLERIISLWAIPLKKGGEVILAERLAREGSRIRIVDVYGDEHLIEPEETRMIELESEPDYSAYGFDKNGEATGLSASSINEFLHEPGKTVNAGGYVSAPLSAIKRWEFEKEWPPTAFLVVWGIAVPVQIAAFASSAGQPGRCEFD